LFYCLSPIELRRLAYDFAEVSNTRSNLNSVTKLAGIGWLALFLKRNATITLRKPEGTNINRIDAPNVVVIKRYFQDINTAMGKIQLP